LKGSRDNSDIQDKVKSWLLGRYGEFKRVLIDQLVDPVDSESMAVTLNVLMKLLSAESKYMAPDSDGGYCPRELLSDVICGILKTKSEDVETVIELFAGEDYLETYDDLRYHFYREVAEIVAKKETLLEDVPLNTVSDRLIDLLMAVQTFPDSDDEIEDFYFSKPVLTKTAMKNGTPLKQTSHKAMFQKAWLSAMSLPMTADQYKAILIVLHKRIIPYMIKPQLLMDFLTDAYNTGGAVSVLALNGLFSLMQKYNLDYPDFYKNLYALFDSSIMHVKYRSRFLRLVDLFLSSTHLPATIMASFIKIMARLSLYAPPSAIIAIVPFIYNQLKRHPTCMIMIHNPRPQDDYKDPFDIKETNPLYTNALESSLWELETLQTHYHPNVASLAKIMSQPFRKPHYNLEDFLDHTYKGLLESEVNKKIKNKPPVEFETYDSVLQPSQDLETPTNSYIQGWSW
jgi:U3 small nucleolar RNA-associated protein 19